MCLQNSKGFVKTGHFSSSEHYNTCLLSPLIQHLSTFPCHHGSSSWCGKGAAGAFKQKHGCCTFWPFKESLSLIKRHTHILFNVCKTTKKQYVLCKLVRLLFVFLMMISRFSDPQWGLSCPDESSLIQTADWSDLAAMPLKRSVNVDLHTVMLPIFLLKDVV